MFKRILRICCLCLIPVLLFAACGTGGKETAPTQKVEEKPDIAADGVLNIMMVGNSFCYYYVEELYALLMENPPEGIQQVNVYNLYYSGCKLTQHLNWWVEGAANYDLYKVDANGRQKMGEKWKLDDAIVMADWDYISLQGTPSGASYLSDDTRELSIKCGEQAAPILNMFHERFPKAQLMWHHTWYPEIGRVTDDGFLYTAEDGPRYDAAIEQVCKYMCEEFTKDKDYDLIRVPSGPAWTVARKLNETANVLPYGGLCARLGKNSFGDKRENAGDGYHDGDIGGAQLLNAYIWYMVITGDTDLTDSTYVPEYRHNSITYKLEQAQVDMLKEAAMTSFAVQ